MPEASEEMVADEADSVPLRRYLRLPRWTMAVLLVIAVVVVMSVIFGRSATQAALEGVFIGSVYVLGASGLSLTYGIKRFANFAHGDLMTVGAYLAFTVNVLARQDILLGVVCAIVGVALLGIFLELSIFRRLEGRAPVAALIASVGVSLVLQNILGAIFTGNVQYVNVGVPRDVVLGSTGLGFNPVKHGVTLLVSGGFVLFLHILLTYTTLGKAMRACADDLDLARTSGISTRNVILWTWVIAGSFAAVAGVLLAIIVNVYPLLGFFFLLFIFAAVIVGGIGSPYGAMLGGLIIGVVQELSKFVFVSIQRTGLIEGGAEYGPVGAFLVLIAVLLFMPEGLMGRRRYGMGGRVFARRARRAKAGVEDLG